MKIIENNSISFLRTLPTKQYKKIIIQEMFLENDLVFRNVNVKTNRAPITFFFSIYYKFQEFSFTTFFFG